MIDMKNKIDKERLKLFKPYKDHDNLVWSEFNIENENQILQVIGVDVMGRDRQNPLSGVEVYTVRGLKTLSYGDSLVIDKATLKIHDVIHETN